MNTEIFRLYKLVRANGFTPKFAAMQAISEIKQKTLETAPYFFTSKTLKFFGQTMKSFKVYKQLDGRYKISAPMKDLSSGKVMGETVRFFNPANNELEHN